MKLNYILLQANNGSSQFIMQLLLIGGILMIFFLFFILPQQRKQKEQQKIRDVLKVGDEVVTIGGIRGKISALDTETVTLQVDKSTKITFEKYAISPEATQKLMNQSKT